MERLTAHQRIALQEIGPPGEGPVPVEVFDEFERRGWGYWDAEYKWCVTATGRRALELDDYARRIAPPNQS